MLSDLRALTRPFRIMLYSALALQALAGVSSLFPWLAIARLVDADPAAYPFWLGVAAGGLALWLFAQTLALHLTHLLDARLCHRLRSQLAAKLARLPLNWFVRQGESGGARALSQDIQALHQLVAHAPAELVQLAVVPGCALALLAAVQWPLLLFTLIPLLAAALLFRVIRSPRMRSAFEQRDRAFRQLNDDYRQLAAYPLLARQFPGAGIEARARQSLRGFLAAFHRWLRRIGALGAVAQLLLSAALSAGWLLLGVRWLAPDLTLAELALFVLLLRSVAQPVMAMGHGGDALRAATLAAGRIRALLAHPEIRWGGRSTIASAPLGAALRLSDLGCRQDERWLLQGVNLAVEPGEWLAIVGASGSGKSTLLRLIARYSEPDSGTVSLDGVLADAFSAQAFNQMVAVVPQENTPPAMSLRDNLTLLVDGAEAAQLRRALAELGLAERLQDRLDDTPSLSGGEAQRLAIARALLARRPLLLADEPTSAQDRQNRECILTALAQLPATRLVATHDAELCRRADRVAVLAEGRLLAVGTPAELADHPALLAVLAEHQEADDEV